MPAFQIVCECQRSDRTTMANIAASLGRARNPVRESLLGTKVARRSMGVSLMRRD